MTIKADQSRAEATRDALGGGGCYYERATSSGHVSGIAVESVDTLGAGDTFVVGLVAYLSVDRDFGVVGECDTLVPALRFARPAALGRPAPRARDESPYRSPRLQPNSVGPRLQDDNLGLS